MNNKLPQGMSQLDYLWTHFGFYEPSKDNTIGNSPNVLVTESALNQYVFERSGDYISELKLREVDDNKIELVGVSSKGAELSIVQLEKEDYLVDISIKSSTQDDCCKCCNEPLLVFTMLSGKQHIVNLKSLSYQGKETDSIIVTTKNGEIKADLKLDKSLEKPCINFDVTDDGLRVSLKVSCNERQLKLVRTEKGLDVINKWSDGSDIAFEFMNYSDYKILSNDNQIKSGTIYFLLDTRTIYLNGIKFGSGDVTLVDSDTTYIEGSSVNVKISKDEFNLLKIESDGLSTKLYWEE